MNVGRADELLVHTVKYLFPPVRGGETRGVATAWAASPLRDKLADSGERQRSGIWRWNSNNGGGGKTLEICVAPDPATATLTAGSPGTTTATVTLTAGVAPVAGDRVAITTSDPGVTIGPATDHGNGTYTFPITVSTTVGPVTVIATDDTVSPHAPATAKLTQKAPKVKLKLKPSTLPANGAATATATITACGRRDPSKLARILQVAVE